MTPVVVVQCVPLVFVVSLRDWVVFASDSASGPFHLYKLCRGGVSTLRAGPVSMSSRLLIIQHHRLCELWRRQAYLGSRFWRPKVEAHAGRLLSAESQGGAGHHRARDRAQTYVSSGLSYKVTRIQS